MSGTVLQLRRVTPDDLPAVLQLERACFSDPWSPASFKAALRPDVFFTCVTDGAGGRLLGYVVAWFVMDQGEVANLAVDPAARRQGVGGALLDAVIAKADGRECSLFLEVRESNVGARELYASRGFTEVGRRRNYYRLPAEDAIVLRRGPQNPEVSGSKS